MTKLKLCADCVHFKTSSGVAPCAGCLTQKDSPHWERKGGITMAIREHWSQATECATIQDQKTTEQASAPRILADDGNRENYPLYDGLFAYFPAALCEVARWSKIGNDKHNPGEPMHWAREKSTDHENKILRHLIDARQVDANGVVEAVALAWRALALCQTILEERGWSEGANARRNPVDRGEEGKFDRISGVPRA